MLRQDIMQWEEAMDKLKILFPDDIVLRSRIQGRLAMQTQFEHFFCDNPIQSRAALMTLVVPAYRHDSSSAAPRAGRLHPLACCADAPTVRLCCFPSQTCSLHR